MSGQLFQTYFEKGESRFSWPSIAFLGAGGKDFSDVGFLDTIAWVRHRHTSLLISVRALLLQ